MQFVRQTPQELVQALLKRGCTQQDLAAAACVSQATISRMASGQHKDPKSSTVDALRLLAACAPPEEAEIR